MPISVASPVRRPGLAAALRAVVRAALTSEGRTPGDIAIVLVRDPEIRALNGTWRGIDRATDVLSFSYDEGAAGSPRVAHKANAVNGDLVISLDRVAVQARRYRVTPGRELARLAVHGALHLSGLDHARDTQRRHMRRREAAAMRSCSERVRALERALRPGWQFTKDPG
jgi:probable rRNA maturation factor